MTTGNTDHGNILVSGVALTCHDRDKPQYSWFRTQLFWLRVTDEEVSKYAAIVKEVVGNFVNVDVPNKQRRLTDSCHVNGKCKLHSIIFSC
jgi:hypothetical protein